MKKSLLWPLIVLLTLAAPSTAQARAGQLDKHFGKAGKVLTLLGENQPEAADRSLMQMAWAPGGKIVTTSGDRLLEYLPDGHLNRGFGENGKVRVEAPAGTTLKPVGMTVDSRGRILVAGTVYPSTSVFISRYLPDGTPDESFGQAGTVVTNLGLPAPPPPPNRGLYPTPVSEGPVVEAAGLAVDAADRPLLAGDWVRRYQFCYPFIADTPRTTGFVARLTVDGSLDSSFGGDGVAVPDPSKEVAASLVVDGDGVLSIGTLQYCLRVSPTEPELARVTRAGNLNPHFGSGGLLDLPFWERPTMARDGSRHILLLGWIAAGEDPVLQRLSPAGTPDRRFGHRGEIRLPSESYGALEADRHGRPILAGNDGPLLLVERRRRDGTIDRNFGREGEAATVFSGNVQARQVLIGGGGKIVAGGTFSRGSGYGIVLARYLSR